MTNIVYKLMKLVAICFIIFISIDFLIVNSASANSIPAGFGVGTKIATHSEGIAVENLNIGDRLISYSFETHRHQKNIVKKIKKSSSFSYYLINRKTKVASSDLIYRRTIVAPELVTTSKIRLGNKLFSKKTNSIVVDSIERLVEPTNIYQIILDNKVGNVYADKILIHAGFELPPYFKNHHVDCKPGTPYFKQCANINAKTLPGFLAALAIVALGLTIINKLFRAKLDWEKINLVQFEPEVLLWRSP